MGGEQCLKLKELGFSKEKLLVTGTDGTTGWLREVKGEETRDEESSAKDNCAR